MNNNDSITKKREEFFKTFKHLITRNEDGSFKLTAAALADDDFLTLHMGVDKTKIPKLRRYTSNQLRFNVDEAGLLYCTVEQ